MSPAALAAVASTDFRDSPKGLFSSPPQCYMHRQASFIPSFFPEGTELGADADFFYFPAYAEQGSGQAGAGRRHAGLHHQGQPPAARAFIECLKTPIAHEVWMAQTGFLTPLKSGQHRDSTATPTLKKQGEILLNADHLPLRRVGPDAGRRGRGHLLDRHGRLRRRQVRAGSGRRDPGQLAEVI